MQGPVAGWNNSEGELMLTWKERLIAITIGVGVAWVADLLLDPLNFSGNMKDLIGACVVYLLISVYCSFELVWVGRENYFHPFIILWHVSSLLIIGLRVLLYFHGLWTIEGPASKFRWMTAMGIQIMITLWLQRILKVRKFGKDSPLD